MQQSTIDAIIEFAHQAFLAQESPDKFARAAAYEAAHSAAARHSDECADSATLIAANEFNASASDAALYSSRLTDAAHDRLSFHRRYRAERASFEDVPIFPIKITEKPYASITSPVSRLSHMTGRALTSSYLSVFAKNSSENHKAKHAARYVYRHVYCAARAAYVVAFYEANRAQDPTTRHKLFQNRITQRLNEDLNYDQIKPSLWLQCMGSLTLQVMAGIVLTSGVVVLMFGLFGVGALPFAETVASGVSAMVVGLACLIGSVFAQKELASIEEANTCSEEVNQLS